MNNKLFLTNINISASSKISIFGKIIILVWSQLNNCIDQFDFILIS